jgi:hypothetical protein
MASYALGALVAMHLLAALVAALVFPVGATRLTMRSLTLDLIPNQTLPILVDPAALAPDATVEVLRGGQSVPHRNAGLVVFEAPQHDACPYLHIGLGASDAIEVLPALPPQNPHSTTLLPATTGSGFACSWLLSIDDDKGIVLRPGDLVRWLWQKDISSGPIKFGKVRAIRGAATRMEGAFAFSSREGGRPRNVEIESDWLDVVSLHRDAHDPREIAVVLESGRPTAFTVDDSNRKPAWFFRRWWHFVKTIKVGADLARKVFPGA